MAAIFNDEFVGGGDWNSSRINRDPITVTLSEGTRQNNLPAVVIKGGNKRTTRGIAFHSHEELDALINDLIEVRLHLAGS